MAKCKRCQSKPTLTPGEIEKMVREIRSMKGIKLVDEDKYRKRLEICQCCEKFEYNSTCTLCGCVMQVRAMLADGRCPYPKSARW